MANREEILANQAAIDRKLELLQREEDAQLAAFQFKLDAEKAAGKRGRNRSLFPKIWQRFKNHIEDGETPAGQEPTKSGANITLADLAKKNEGVDFEALAAGSPINLEGWVGTPDPAKYKPGTNYLTEAELQEECRKGNVVKLDDWVEGLAKLDTWEKELLYKAVLADWMQNRFFVRMADGSRVSFWDLYEYVHHNPELKALAARQRNIPTLGQGGAGGEGDGAAAAALDMTGGTGGIGEWNAQGGVKWMTLPKEAAKDLPWGLVSQGACWARRPTRWLKGMDGVCDFTFGMYACEDAVQQVLGPKYGGQDPRDVLADREYARDVLEAGPLMGMSFLVTAARELPLKETREVWIDRLGKNLMQRLQRQGPQRALPPAASTSGASSPEAEEEAGGSREEAAQASTQALAELYLMMDPDRLALQTALLDTSGTKLRCGSSLLLRTNPNGLISVKAMSPGGLREREHYALGTVQDAPLSQALLDLFLGEGAVDPGFVRDTHNNLLLFANGFKQGNVDDNPNVTAPEDPGPHFSMELIPAKASVFRLPRVGEAAEGAASSSAATSSAPLLLKNVRERLICKGMAELFEKAEAAARAVPPPPGPDDDARREKHVGAMRAAAERVLAQGAQHLLGAQGLPTAAASAKAPVLSGARA